MLEPVGQRGLEQLAAELFTQQPDRLERWHHHHQVWSGGVDIMFLRVSDFPWPGLSLAHGGSLWALKGKALEVRLTVNNAGHSISTNTILTVRPPVGLNYQSSFPEGLDVSAQGGILNVSLGDIAANLSTNLTLFFSMSGPTFGWQTIGLNVTSDAIDGYPIDNTLQWPVLVDDDVDLDGIPDSLEKAFWPGTEFLSHCTSEDFDQDGVSDGDEFKAGTDPTDPAGNLRLSMPESDNATVWLHLPQATRLPLVIQFKDSVGGDWWLLDTRTNPNAASQPVVDVINPGQPKRFYRLEVPQLGGMGSL